MIAKGVNRFLFVVAVPVMLLCARGLNSKVRARRVRDKKIPQLEEQLKLNADPTGESQPRAYV